MESLNRMAIELVDEAIDFADELGIEVHYLDNEAVVLDFGVHVDGGIEAGLLLAEIQTAGLATIQTRVDDLDGAPFLVVELATDHPVLSLLCSQHPGWDLPEPAEHASGPARLFVGAADEFVDTNYTETFDLTVLSLQTATLPTPEDAAAIAERVGVSTSGMFLAVAPAASTVGAVTAAARAAEVAVHRLMNIGYEPSNVVAAAGSAPVPPIAGEEHAAVANTHDALARASRTFLVLTEDLQDPATIPFNATPRADQWFADILDDAAGDVGALADLLAPAQATLAIRGGPTYMLGETDVRRLVEQWSE